MFTKSVSMNQYLLLLLFVFVVIAVLLFPMSVALLQYQTFVEIQRVVYLAVFVETSL